LAEVYIKHCRVLENRRLMEETLLMRLQAPEIALAAQPGQFVMVRTGPRPEKGGPLLRRPFSLHRIYASGEIALLYRVIGLGTGLMEDMKPGDELEIMGPLGHGFDLTMAAPQSYLVAGGMGMAPMIALAEALESRENTFFYGARTSREVEVFWTLIKETSYKGRVSVTSEDGIGFAGGLITDPLAAALRAKPVPIFACGPRPMLAQVAGLAGEAGVPAQVSLEARMACGLGACLSCVVEMDAGKKSGEYSRVCSEGPVFLAGEVKW